MLVDWEVRKVPRDNRRAALAMGSSLEKYYFPAEPNTRRAGDTDMSSGQRVGVWTGQPISTGQPRYLVSLKHDRTDGTPNHHYANDKSNSHFLQCQSVAMSRYFEFK